jgi:hypothetical protein
MTRTTQPVAGSRHLGRVSRPRTDTQAGKPVVYSIKDHFGHRHDVFTLATASKNIAGRCHRELTTMAVTLAAMATIAHTG